MQSQKAKRNSKRSKTRPAHSRTAVTLPLYIIIHVIILHESVIVVYISEEYLKVMQMELNY